ncbi:DUF3833 domain-containing protein [Vannielia litorea]|uniref:DUF3833 domain-containing protein n=1 Tax=Vannielia litorea TaxID=1217970 RepID=UPI001BCC7474|nr:DUF3833 domain-containing protein [Vannielia litorea]MBS8228515.1 DUF3833 domain-containing protein [Vannielia litorea]
MLALTLFLALCLGLVAYRARALSFMAQRPAAYAQTAPAFDPRRVLSGPMASEGVIYGPTGKVASRFVARMEGRWEGERGVLAEEFTYDSGRQQSRRWDLVVHNDGRVTATAPDIIGTAEGDLSGATLRLRYRLKLPEEAGGHALDVTDWLYLMPNGTVMNRSQMRRFGVTLAELVATMRPEQGTGAAHV